MSVYLSTTYFEDGSKQQVEIEAIEEKVILTIVQMHPDEPISAYRLHFRQEEFAKLALIVGAFSGDQPTLNLEDMRIRA